MALILSDRVKSNTTTTGTGTVVLSSTPPTGYQSFAVIGDGNTTYYTIAGQTTSEWEVGIGTYYAGNSSLSRTTILASSAANAAVTFSAGTKDVFVTYPAEKSVNRDATGNVTISQVLTVGANSALGGATNPIVAITGSANNYIQSYIYNLGNGAYTSSDFVVYPINGSDTAGWVDMGITGPVYNQAAYSVTGANEGYVFMSAPTASGSSGNLVFATDSTGVFNSMQWYTGGFAQSKANAQMTLSNSGALVVSGSIKSNSTGFIFPDNTVQITAATAGAQAAGNSSIIINNVNITANATIAAGQNGFSVGPVNTANGVTVTVVSGQRWVVI